MKTAISIPDELYEAAEKEARLLGLSRSKLYTIAVTNFLKARNGTEITDALNRVYAEESSELDPVLEEMQFRSFPKEDW